MIASGCKTKSASTLTVRCGLISAPCLTFQACAGLKKERNEMNRAERRALGVPKTVASNIEEAEKRRTVNTYSVAVASVLWDSGMSKDDVHAILGKILDRFDTIKKDYATMEDYRIMLREEAGIEIKYC